MKVKINIPPIYAVLTMVWLVLLGLCGVIYILIVPMSISSLPIRYTVNVLKVIFAFGLLLIWLYSWYVMIKMVLVYELNISNNPVEESVDQ